MRRAMGIVWAAGAASILFSACEGGGYYDDRYGTGAYGYCQQATSCSTCTPILGCGWCSYGDGKGVCLSEPNACRVKQFTWTWEPTGCAALADAGPSGDAPGKSPTGDAGADAAAGDDTDPDAPTGDGSTAD